jgi:hypothetical protein
LNVQSLFEDEDDDLRNGWTHWVSWKIEVLLSTSTSSPLSRLTNCFRHYRLLLSPSFS